MIKSRIAPNIAFDPARECAIYRFTMVEIEEVSGRFHAAEDAFRGLIDSSQYHAESWPGLPSKVLRIDSETEERYEFDREARLMGDAPIFPRCMVVYRNWYATRVDRGRPAGAKRRIIETEIRRLGRPDAIVVEGDFLFAFGAGGQRKAGDLYCLTILEGHGWSHARLNRSFPFGESDLADPS